MARGVLHEIAENLHQIDAVDGDAGVARDAHLEGGRRPGRGERARQRVHDLGDRRLLAAAREAAAARPRQLARHMTMHGVADAIERARDLGLALLAQETGVGGQRGERRLQPVGEIGGAIARARDLLVALVEQAVDLVDQRLHLRRRRRVEPAAAALGDLAHRHAEAGERREAEPDLNPSGEGQPDRDEKQRRDQLRGKGVARAGDAGEIERHQHADAQRRSAAERDAALPAEQRIVPGASQTMIENPIAALAAGGEIQRLLAERGGPLDVAAVVARRLPIKARAKPCETRVRRRGDDAQAPFGVDVEIGDQLADIGLYVVVHRAFDVMLEQQHQHEARQRERRGDGGDAGEEQPQAQRARPHASRSGIR